MYYPVMATKKENSVDGGIGYWVGSLASAFRKGLTEELAPFNVSPVKWAILEMCYRGEANTPSGLARVIPVDTAAISRQLDKLKDQGLIRRRRLSKDRRSVRVELTEAGRAMAEKLAPSEQANNARFLQGITEAEQAALTGIIQKMLKNAAAADY